MLTEQIRLTEKSNGQIKEAMPKTEVVAKAKRRRFSAVEKQVLPGRAWDFSQGPVEGRRSGPVGLRA